MLWNCGNDVKFYFSCGSDKLDLFECRNNVDDDDFVFGCEIIEFKDDVVDRFNMDDDVEDSDESDVYSQNVAK